VLAFLFPELGVFDIPFLNVGISLAHGDFPLASNLSASSS